MALDYKLVKIKLKSKINKAMEYSSQWRSYS